MLLCHQRNWNYRNAAFHRKRTTAVMRSPHDYPQKTLKMSFFRGNSRFVLKFYGNRPPGTGRNDELFWWQKVSKMRFFSAILRPFGRGKREPNVNREACHMSLALPVKFRPSLFRFDCLIDWSFNITHIKRTCRQLIKHCMQYDE